MQKVETEANSHVSEEVTVTWRKGSGSKPFAEGRNQTGSCVATALFTLGSFGAGKERQAAPSRETIWRKIDFQTGFPQETQGTSMKRPWRSWSGRGGSRTNFLSSLLLFHSNLLHKSRDIGKRVSRFLCNEFAVGKEREKEGSKSRGCGWKREPCQVNISFYKWSSRRDRDRDDGARRARSISVEEVVMQSKIYMQSMYISVLILLYMKFTYHSYF